MNSDDPIVNAFQNLRKTRQIVLCPITDQRIGEHIGYNGGMVLPAAIEIGTYAMASQKRHRPT